MAPRVMSARDYASAPEPGVVASAVERREKAMPSFPKPSFEFNYQTAVEISRLRAYRDHEPGRQIPAKADNRLLIATWNIANLGAQERRDKDYRVLAEIISWFDMVAVQE